MKNFEKKIQKSLNTLKGEITWSELLAQHEKAIETGLYLSCDVGEFFLITGNFWKHNLSVYHLERGKTISKANRWSISVPAANGLGCWGYTPKPLEGNIIETLSLLSENVGETLARLCLSKGPDTITSLISDGETHHEITVSGKTAEQGALTSDMFNPFYLEAERFQDYFYEVERFKGVGFRRLHTEDVINVLLSGQFNDLKIIDLDLEKGVVEARACPAKILKHFIERNEHIHGKHWIGRGTHSNYIEVGFGRKPWPRFSFNFDQDGTH